MTSITQINVFEDQELGDLEKLRLLFDRLPDEELLDALDHERAEGGRRDWSNRSLWYCYLAKFILQHSTTAELIRELKRNSQLRQLCELEGYLRVRFQSGCSQFALVPSPSAFSRFEKRLMKHQNKVEAMKDELLTILYKSLPNFGVEVAVDGKFIESYAQRQPKDRERTETEKADGRIETDATYSAKTYKNADNQSIKTVYFYGFKVHLLCDVTYELPLAWRVTPANCSEIKVLEEMIPTLPDLVRNRAKYAMLDAGYDSGNVHRQFVEEEIIPLIDKRRMWKGSEVTRQYLETDLIYNEDGEVFYVDHLGKEIPMKYLGYDKETDSLRYGFHPQYQDSRIFRIKCSVDDRIFTRVARGTLKYQRLYKKRTAIERVNGRIDRDLKFECHTIRGLDKMKLRVGVGFLVMLGFAVAKVMQDEREHLASWVA